MIEDSKHDKTIASKTEDYYIGKDGNLVFTAHYLSKRGYCCQNGCRHCPYDYKK